MIDFYKVVSDGYIDGFGTNGPDTVTEITEAEYAELQAVFSERPTPPDGYDYQLQDDPLEWVLVELPPEPDPDVDDDEALVILLGGAG